MAEDIKTTGIDQKKLRPLLNKVRNSIKKHPVIKEMFEKHDVDVSEIDLIPMAFADLDVSARTDHGIIYFSTKLLEDGNFEKDDHYMVHEIVHFLQHTTGTKPTQGAMDGDYLKNPAEIEGFQFQTDYISDTRGDDAAEDYVNKVLDHHDESGKERESKKEVLLNRAQRLHNILYC